jgi:hypothetical protein
MARMTGSPTLSGYYATFAIFVIFSVQAVHG